MIRKSSRRSLVLRSSSGFVLTLALLGCGGQAPVPMFNNSMPSLLGGNPAMSTMPAAQGNGKVTGKTSGNIALLVPLTGNPVLVQAGQALENAAKLAFPDFAAGQLDIRDTGGTPQGAAAAAQAAIAAGDGIILGPLTSAEAHAVAPIAQSANVNMLAFSNDGSLAAPGVWPLGITPAQQVQRVVAAAANAGRTQLAALLPDTDFGHSLGDAITAETSSLSEPAPQIVFYESGYQAVSQAAQQISDYADRGAGIDAEIKAAKDEGTPAGNQKARELALQQIPPPNFNALFIGAADDETLAELANYLPYYYVSAPQVQFLGPALWATIAPDMASQPVLVGAMYAAPDPAAATAFDAKYSAAYGGPPPAIADVGFDAAAIARLAQSGGGFTSTVLTAPAGFTGTDGVLVLQPDGQVLRGLAVFQVEPGAPVITSPAPATLSPPSS